MKITIRKMCSDDIISIEKNFNENFDDFWSIDILKSELKNSNSRYVIAKNNDSIVGFAGIKITLDTADIMNIAVKKNVRELGIGSLLLEKLIYIAISNNCTSLMLEVNNANLHAITLYEKYGFRRISLRKKYYNNTYDAIIMQKKN